MTAATADFCFTNAVCILTVGAAILSVSQRHALAGSVLARFSFVGVVHLFAPFIYRQCQFEEVEVCTLPNNPKNADWDAAAKHLTASLDKFKVPEKEKGEILAFVTTLKNDIVEK